MFYKTMTESEKNEYCAWLDELDAQYCEEEFIEEKAAEESERNFDHYQW